MALFSVKQKQKNKGTIPVFNLCTCGMITMIVFLSTFADGQCPYPATSRVGDTTYASRAGNNKFNGLNDQGGIGISMQTIVIIFHLDVILFVRCLLLFFFASLYQCTALRCHTLSAIDRREEIPLLPASRREILVCIFRSDRHTLISLTLLAANKEIHSLSFPPSIAYK